MDFRKRRFLEALLFIDLTSKSGTSFQARISDFLAAVYGNDFERTISAGRHGDRGCDGYNAATKTVYQCYGKERGSGVNTAFIISKIQHDFQVAQTHFGQRMVNWVFVHNLVEGLPTDVGLAIQALREQNPQIHISTMTKDGIGSLLFALPDDALDLLFAPSPDRSFDDIDPADIQRLLKTVAAGAREATHGELMPVPREKISYNTLSEPAARVVRDNVQYVGQVAKFVREDADPIFGEAVASSLNAKYQSLRSQGMSSDDIMDELLGFVVGRDRLDYSISELKAAEVIVAYFFNNCDVFEDQPRS
ncbi:MAG TPA: ABC-three component system protein [Candidatus Eremiobacteraceae bacterium]